MISVTRMEELFTTLLETRADELARSTGFVQRERKLSGADFVQILTFGHLRDPTSRLDQLTQVAQLREVQITSSGLHQRLTEPASRFLQAVVEEVVGQVLAAEPVEIALLKRLRTCEQRKIYFASRIKSPMVMADRRGKRINLLTALPQRVGQSKVLRVQVGWRKHMHLRLLAVRVPDEVVEQRRKVLQEQARKHGRKISQMQWDAGEMDAAADQCSGQSDRSRPRAGLHASTLGH